jgi:hypothetical protein
MLCEGLLGGENAAFDSNGELLGVAGIDVFIVELGTLSQSVEEALQQRVVGTYVPLNNSIPLQFNCSLEVSYNSFKHLNQCLAFSVQVFMI